MHINIICVCICCHRGPIEKSVESTDAANLEMHVEMRAANGQCRSWQLSVDIGVFVCACNDRPIADGYLSFLFKTVFRLSALSLTWVNWCHQLEIIVPTHSNRFVCVLSGIRDE